MKQPGEQTTAILVHINFGQQESSAALDEFILLVKSAGAKPLSIIEGRRDRPDAALFVGSGKSDEIVSAAKEQEADLIIFNHALSPVQQRNLESRLENVRVVDRESLILDIFAQRARSAQGKLQVELAQLQYLSTRLVRAWTHLERQKGGIGLRGPGETQLETDRRLISDRLKYLKSKREKLLRQQSTQRRARMRNKVFSVSLVGYTNAGKSSLFNLLSKADTYAADQLFATLDTTSRRIYLGEAGQLVLSDTVGFIRDLPHQLIDSFKATLDETVHADLLLHIVDASSSDRDAQALQVEQVLAEVGASDIPRITVWNKIDLVPELQQRSAIERDECDKIRRVFISVNTNSGIVELRQALSEALENFKTSSFSRTTTENHFPQDN
jgi:GTPase